MSTFWNLLKDSVITQGLVTLALTVTVCYLGVTGQPVPELVAYGFTAVLGYFFGVKTQQAIRRA